MLYVENDKLAEALDVGRNVEDDTAGNLDPDGVVLRFGLFVVEYESAILVLNEEESTEVLTDALIGVDDECANEDLADTRDISELFVAGTSVVIVGGGDVWCIKDDELEYDGKRVEVEYMLVDWVCVVVVVVVVEHEIVKPVFTPGGKHSTKIGDEAERKRNKTSFIYNIPVQLNFFK